MTTIDFTAPRFDGSGPVAPLAGNVRFGAATAAFQVEGATHEDGRGESIWDRFCHTPGAVANGDTGDVACDHYRRWRADLDLMAALGLETYRFSIAWPRVQPDGRGAANQRGLGFYRRLAEGLRERGIEPIATLYHWDLPQALQDEGGWASRDTALRFADYARVVGDALGDVVTQWITHNEPWVVAFLGHAHGTKAPGIRDWPTALRVSHHLLLSHGLAVPALRAAAPAGVRPEVGIALNLAPVHAAGPGADHAEAAARMDGHLNRWFLDPLLRGRYPDDMLALYERRYGPLREARDGDLEAIGAPMDFLGVNYYSPQRVFAAPRGGPLELDHAPAAPPITAMGWEVDPGGLHDLLLRLRRDYGPLPVYITENGASFDDPPATDGLVEDPQRTAYLRGHLEALARAVADGVDVRRYCVWSLLDNFEWEHGYDKRFGIVHVEYETQRRVPKRSGLWYRDFIGWMRRLRRA
jgi:beta-glucosidase